MPIESVRLLLEWAALSERMTELCNAPGLDGHHLDEWPAAMAAEFRDCFSRQMKLENAIRAHARHLRETAAGMSEAAE